MAWYDGIYSCGHEGRVNVIGPGKDRQWKIDREFSGLCPECYKKEQAEKRANANAEAAKKSAEMDLPKLEGSEKQVAWANTLRLTFYERFIKLMENVRKLPDDKIPPAVDSDGNKHTVSVGEISEAVDEGMRNHIDARYWIDRRSQKFPYILGDFIQEWLKENEIPAEVKKEMAQEAESMSVKPDSSCKPGIARILWDGATLRAEYPKDQDFMDIVKGLGYKWDGSTWNKKITEFTGSADDRAAELGNKLLSSGFTVQFPNMESKDMAISGAFSPENDRWVKYHVNAKQLAIVWKKRSDTLYDAAKKLPGARWKDGSMRVKVEFYREVEDFTDTMGFSISQLAKEKIEEYKQKEKSFETVLAKTVESENIDDSDRIRRSMVLSGGIIEDLIDE